jgi:hypothetical protein
MLLLLLLILLIFVQFAHVFTPLSIKKRMTTKNRNHAWYLVMHRALEEPRA